MLVCSNTWSPALITPCLDILAFTPLSIYGFPNKLAPNVPNNMLKSTFLFFYFIFNCFATNIYQQSSMISSSSSFEIINVVIPDFFCCHPCFLCIPSSTADAAAVKTNGNETLLANG